MSFVKGTASAVFTGGWFLLDDEASRPGVTATDDGTGTSFTLAVTGDAGGTHQSWYRAGASGAWTLGPSRVGNGDIQITGLTAGKYEAMVATVSPCGTGFGPAEKVAAWATTTEDTSSEIQAGLIAELDANADLSEAMGVAGRVYLEFPPKARTLPVIVYTIEGGQNPESNFEGVLELTLTMTVYATTRAKAREVEEILDAALNDHQFDTSNWKVFTSKRRTGAVSDSDLLSDGNPVYSRQMEWPMTARKEP